MVQNPKEYWEKLFTEKWDLSTVGYNVLGLYYNNWLYQVRKKVFLRLVKRLNLDFSNLNVLDIGSGTGFYIDLWSSLNVKSLTGVDLTNTAVKNLQHKYPGTTFYQFDVGGQLIEELKGKKYDVISAFDMLFHIVDDKNYEMAYKNISSLLSPGGLFMFSEIFICNKEIMRTPIQAFRPLNYIKDILKNSMLTLKLSTPMFVLMNYPAKSKSLFAKKMWNVFILYPIMNFKLLGFVVGGLLYPMELFLTSYLKDGPTTEIMICEKYK